MLLSTNSIVDSMPRKKATVLTDAELRIMQVLWQKNRATVREVTEALSAQTNLAYNTVLTTLGTLKRKGYVNSERIGRADVFQPLVTRHQAQSKALRNMVHRFFSGNASTLALNLVEEGHLDREQLVALLDEIKRREDGLPKG